jgi:hypothetical protein
MHQIGKQVSGTVPLDVFAELEARARAQYIAISAVVRQVLCLWFEGLPEDAKYTNVRNGG